MSTSSLSVRILLVVGLLAVAAPLHAQTAGPCDSSTISRTGFAGYYYDCETGLYSTPSRYYDPETGRFISRDGFDFGDINNPPSLHLYNYAQGNPLRYVDPSGHSSSPAFWLLEAAWEENVAGPMREKWNALVGTPAGVVTGAAKEGVHQLDAGSKEAAAMFHDVARFDTSDPRRSAIGQLIEADAPLGAKAKAVGTGALEGLTTGPKQLYEGYSEGDPETFGRGAFNTGAMVYGAYKGAQGVQAALQSGKAFVVGEAAESAALIEMKPATSPNVEQMLRYADELQDEMAGLEGGWPEQQRALMASGQALGMDVPGDELRFIDPADVRFSQSSIKSTMRGGEKIDDLTAGLKGGTVKPSDVPPIRLVERDGVMYTLDNRRLEAFRRAGVEVPYRMATPEEIAAEGWKFTTTNEGTSVRVRGTGGTP